MDTTISGGGGAPSLNPPIDPESPKVVSNAQTVLKSPFQDIIDKQVDQLTRAFLDNLTSNNPVLFVVTSNPSVSASKITGNQWLQPTPATAFVVAFNDMATNLMKSSLIQGFMMAVSLNYLGKLTQESREQIKNSYDAEIQMDIAGIVSGAFTLGASIGSFCMAARVGKFNNASDKSWVSGFSEEQMSGLTTAVQQGVGALGQIIKGIMDADGHGKKGIAEATKVLIDGQSQMMTKMLDAQTDSKKTMEDLISQLMQTLPQLIKDLLSKHGFSLHG